MIPFLAGDNRYGTHAPTMLRHLGPETDFFPGESVAFKALRDGSGPTGTVLIPLPTWMAIMLRVKKFHFTGTASSGYTGTGAPSGGFPPVSGGPISIDDEFDVLHHYTGRIQHGDVFTGEPPDGYHGEPISKDERDIFGPNTAWEGDDNVDPFIPHGLRPQRGLQNKGIYARGGQELPTPAPFGSYSYWQINFGYTPPIVGQNDYYDDNGVYYSGLSVHFGCGVSSLLNGWEANGSSSDGTPSNGAVTVKIHGYPDFVIPLVKSSFIIRRPFTVLGVVTTTFTGSGILEATEFWPYENSAGLPVFDVATGVQLNDPLS